MITTNMDVNDGLTNGAMGAVTNVVIDERTGKMISILVTFYSKHVGQEAIHTRVYKSKNQNAVPIYKTQATFPIHKKTSCQATISQFSLTLGWAVTIHKCQGLTLPEIVIDMTPAKGKFKPGEAYVAFSRVRTLEKLHIINYTQNQIHVSEHTKRDGKTQEKHLATNAIKSISECSRRCKITPHKYWKFQNQNSRYKKMIYFKMQAL